MYHIPGVKVRFFVDGEDVLVDDDGYVGRTYLPGQIVVIEAKAQSGSYGYGIAVDGNKNVVLKKDWMPYRDSDSEEQLFQTIVPLKTSNRGIPHTEYPANTLRMIKAYKDGRVQLWSISLVSQEADFFLITDQTYDVRCSYSSGMVHCPYFETIPHEWPQLVSVLQKVFVDVGVEQLASNVFPLLPEPENVPLERNFARVQFWNSAQQWGAVNTVEGSARVHWSQVPRRPRRAYLIPGEMVSYKALRTPVHTSPPADSKAKERKTSFQREAVGIRVPRPL